MIPILEVWNKLDLIDQASADELRQVAAEKDDVMMVSALTGEGVPDLLKTVESKLTRAAVTVELHVQSGDGKRLAWLHAHGDVLIDEEAEASAEGQPMRSVTVRLNPKELGQFESL